MKGHTKIELTNVKTGEVKVIEDDNLVTNAMAKMIEPTPYCGLTGVRNIFSNSSPLIDKLCGGLLLFSEPIEEDPNKYTTPKNNKMVGNARMNYASGQDVPEFGAYNAEESTWNPATGERKYVYDFSTSKGNGTISCVALTNPFLGYFGTGNYSGKFESLTVESVDYTRPDALRMYFWGSDLRSFPTTCSSDVYSVTEPSILFADYDKNCIYAFGKYALDYSSSYASEHISSGKFNLYKVYFPMNSVNPMEYFTEQWTIQEKIEIEVPSVISSLSTGYAKRSCVCRGDDAIYIVLGNGQSISSNSTFYVWKIGYDLETSEVFTMRNTTGVSIVCGDRSQLSSYNFSQGMFVSDGYLICVQQYGKRVFKMKLSDPTDVTEFENKLNDSSNNVYYFFYRMGGTIIIRNHSSPHCNGAVILNDNVILPVNGKPTFSSESSESNVNSYGGTIPVRGCESFVISTHTDSLCNTNGRLVRNPYVLSTINNLPEPVIKTSDLAMKITYTLSLADDQEAGDS
jgi:hypothetical protein